VIDLGHNEPGIVEITEMPTAHLTWQDEAATQVFAQRLAGNPALRNAFVELRGNLGAGKTTLVRHLLRALGVQGRIKSPTYAVVEPYTLEPAAGSNDDAFNIWHFDFYRFDDPREWADAGFRDIFASPGLKLAEWPQNAGGQLPQADLVIELAVAGDESRTAILTAPTLVGTQLLASAMP
jgi:tRNA threonylcarbamoyladenosine biosynthesis protein TsaE